MRRRAFFGVVAGAAAVAALPTQAAARTSPPRKGKTPGPAWDTITKLHAQLGGDAYVQYYVACDLFCDQLEREMRPISNVVDGGPRRLMAWRHARIFRYDEATARGITYPRDPHSEQLLGYAPGAPGLMGPGWHVMFLDYRHNPGVTV